MESTDISALSNAIKMYKEKIIKLEHHVDLLIKENQKKEQVIEEVSGEGIEELIRKVRKLLGVIKEEQVIEEVSEEEQVIEEVSEGVRKLLGVIKEEQGIEEVNEEEQIIEEIFKREYL